MNTIKIIFFILIFSNFLHANEVENKKKIIYLSADINIPFWQIMAKGIESTTNTFAYDFEIYNSNNSVKKELELTIKAIKEKVAGIIISPTNSSACATVLRLAKEAKIPVVISDVGTDSGEYISYISSNNKEGAYNIGKILAKKMINKKWNKGKVGIIAIPQKRLNGQQRTAGFMEALDESDIKGANIKQISNWSNKETYDYTKQLIENYPELRAIWLQTSNTYNGALKAIKDMKKQNDILLIAFDAEPEFLKLIKEEEIIASGMQQPYLMGRVAAQTIHKHLKGLKVKKDIQIPILSVTTENIQSKLPLIKQNVLGLE